MKRELLSFLFFILVTCVLATNPTANFTVSQSYGSSPLVTHFTDTSVAGSSPITSWQWDLNGDGSIESTEQNPNYTYPVNGNYSVSLTVSDGVNSNTKMVSNQIKVCTGLVAQYSLNGDGNDSSTNGYHGVVSGATFQNDRFGNPNSACFITNANTNHIEFPETFPFNQGNGTFSFWSKALNTTNGFFFYSRGDGVLSNLYNFGYMIAGTSLRCTTYSPSGSAFSLFSVPITSTVWSHCVFTKSGNTFNLYINGVFIQSITRTDLPNYQGKWWLGRPAGTNLLEVLIDDIQLYNCALSGAEVQQLYQNQTVVPPLVINAPNGGETWEAGTTQTINWSALSQTNDLALDYTIDNGTTWQTISTNLPGNQSSYSWTVPATPSTQCKVRIKNRTNPSVVDTSSVFSILPESDLTSNLISHYPLDAQWESPGYVQGNDISGNGHTAQTGSMNGTWDRYGQRNGACHFGNAYQYLDGGLMYWRGQYIDMGDWESGGAMTISGWISYYEYNSYSRFIDMCNSVGQDNILIENVGTSNQLGFFIFKNGQYQTVYVSNYYELYNWIFVTCTVSSTGVMKVYKNGVLAGTNPNGLVPDTMVRTRQFLGRSNWFDSNNKLFNGAMDDVRIYNRELSQNEILELYSDAPQGSLYLTSLTTYQGINTGSIQEINWQANTGVNTVKIELSTNNGTTWTQIATNLPASQGSYSWSVPLTTYEQCKLRISSEQNTAVRDSSAMFAIVNSTLDMGILINYPLDGNAQDATQSYYNGTVTGAVPTYNRYGYANKAMLYTNKSDKIAIPGYATPTVTVSLWYYFNGTSGDWNTLLGGTAAGSHHLIVQNSTNLIGYWNNGFYSSGYALQVGKWYHLAVVKEGTRSRLYVNGVLVQDRTDGISNGSYPITIIGNAYNNLQGCPGIIDDLVFYSRVLSVSEIQQLCGNTATVQVSGHLFSAGTNPQPLQGLTVQIRSGLETQTSTSAGLFTFTNVSVGHTYQLTVSGTGYQAYTQEIYIGSTNLDLGNISISEANQQPANVTATSQNNDTNILLTWSGNSTRSLSNYSIYRLISGNEENLGSWVLVSTVTDTAYTDNTWTSVANGVYKYAVMANYSSGIFSTISFSNEIQKGGKVFSEDFNHSGAVPEGWTTQSAGGIDYPWQITEWNYQDFVFYLENWSSSTADEKLFSPVYDFAGYPGVVVSFYDESYVSSGQVLFQVSPNGTNWQTVYSYVAGYNGTGSILSFNVSQYLGNCSTAQFRWHYTTSAETYDYIVIDDFQIQLSKPYDTYLAAPFPLSANLKSTNRTVQIGITINDDTQVNASTLQYRIDANANGVYDTAEAWIPLTGYTNAQSLTLRVNAVYTADGNNLKYEFKGDDIEGNGFKYSGTFGTNGIADDYYVSVDATPPSLVSDLSVTTAALNSATLSWTPVTEANFSTYEIYYSQSSSVSLNDLKWTLVDNTALGVRTTSSVTINTLESNKTYYYKIRAIDTFGNVSELSNLTISVPINLLPTCATPVPTNQPTPLWSNSRTVTIGCTFADYYGINTSTIQYRFDRNGDGVYGADEGWQNFGSRSSSTRNNSHKREGNITELINSYNFASLTAQQLEFAIRNRAQTTVSVSVTFTSDGSIMRFEFRAMDVNGYGYAYSGTYSQIGIEDDWFVRVDTVNPANTGALVSGTATQTTIPLSWTSGSDFNFKTYQIFYATHANITVSDNCWDWTKDTALLNASATSTTITGLLSGTTYYLRVRAIDEAGNGSVLSNELIVQTDILYPPLAPQNLTITLSDLDGVTLSWSPVTHDTQGNPITVSRYSVYAGDTTDFVIDSGNMVGYTTQTTYTLTNYLSNGYNKKFFKVTAEKISPARRTQKKD